MWSRQKLKCHPSPKPTQWPKLSLYPIPFSPSKPLVSPQDFSPSGSYSPLMSLLQSDQSKADSIKLHTWSHSHSLESSVVNISSIKCQEQHTLCLLYEAKQPRIACRTLLSLNMHGLPLLPLKYLRVPKTPWVSVLALHSTNFNSRSCPVSLHILARPYLFFERWLKYHCCKKVLPRCRKTVGCSLQGPRSLCFICHVALDHRCLRNGENLSHPGLPQADAPQTFAG